MKFWDKDILMKKSPMAKIFYVYGHILSKKRKKKPVFTEQLQNQLPSNNSLELFKYLLMFSRYCCNIWQLLKKLTTYAKIMEYSTLLALLILILDEGVWKKLPCKMVYTSWILIAIVPIFNIVDAFYLKKPSSSFANKTSL